MLAVTLALPVTPSFAADTVPSIGRLNYAGFRTKRHCTVSLVGRQMALTAKHCVEGLPRDRLRIVLGYERGNWKELHEVSRIIRVEKQDVAWLCLAKPSRLKPLRVQSNSREKAIATATGYPRSAAHLQNPQQCHLQAGSPRARFLCPMEPGMSGAPVVQETNEGRQIVAVVSGNSGSSSVVERVPTPPEC
ncbi:serine protease [Ahrensia sp. R2A130]|uniref:trypsin-like serine peptidase n=1 Tax=Ahrensia sp. R2A130 TaxID=744979 RepID=UPI0001E0F060|nr:trypsin-like serine protease [Ahrensia sp. R2A130]EFL90982.1 peptidase S1 and S6 chymotrypsin/Hap [Ahrensia sp. R2A130]